MTAVNGASSSSEACRAGSSLPWLYSIAADDLLGRVGPRPAGLQLSQHLGRRRGGQDGQDNGHRQRVAAEQAQPGPEGLPFGVVLEPAGGVVAAQDAVDQGGGGLGVQAGQRVDVPPKVPGASQVSASREPIRTRVLPPRSRDSRVAELGLLAGVEGVRDRGRGGGDGLGVIQDQQVPGGAQQLGDLLQLRRRRASVGAGLLDRGQQPGADLADDLAGGPGPVL